MAERLGGSVQTLQRWANDGMLKAHRTPKNRRQYTEDQYLTYIKGDKTSGKKNIAYAQVSSVGQKDDLNNQVEFLRNYVNGKGINLDDVFVDIGSGLNYKRKKQSLLLDEVMAGNIDTIYITSKDRFVRVKNMGKVSYDDYCIL